MCSPVIRDPRPDSVLNPLSPVEPRSSIVKRFIAVLSLCFFCPVAASQSASGPGNKTGGTLQTPSGQPPGGGLLPPGGSLSLSVPRVKWEYTLLERVDIEKRGAGDFVAGLNKLGEEGWEAISIIGPRGARGYGETLFKRLKESPRGGTRRADFSGGREGSRSGDAPNQLDPGRIFDRLATGRTTINISDLRMLQEEAQAWAQKQGITNGQLTREQFISFFQSPGAQQARERIRARFTGAAGGGDDSDRRLRDLERRLDEVMRQLERMRQDMQRARPEQGPAPNQKGRPGRSSSQEGQPGKGRGSAGPAEISNVIPKALGNSKGTEKEATNVIRLKHAKAAPLLSLLQELYGQKEHFRMACDDRTNSLVLVGGETLLVEVVALIEQLDVPGDAKNAK